MPSAFGQVIRVDGLFYTSFADIQLGAAEYWADKVDGEDDVRGVVYLAGKTVYFYTNISTGGAPLFDVAQQPEHGDGFPWYVGTITSATPVIWKRHGWGEREHQLRKGHPVGLRGG